MAVPTEVVTPEATLFSGGCDFIVARGRDGELGVLPHHAPLMTTLKPGPLVLRQGREELVLFIVGGFLEVLPERVTVLADAGEPGREIDPGEAQVRLKAAEDRLAQDRGLPEASELAAEVERCAQRLRTAELARSSTRP